MVLGPGGVRMRARLGNGGSSDGSDDQKQATTDPEPTNAPVNRLKNQSGDPRLTNDSHGGDTTTEQEAEKRAIQMQKLGATEQEIEQATGVDPTPDKGDPGYVGDPSDTNTSRAGMSGYYASTRSESGDYGADESSSGSTPTVMATQGTQNADSSSSSGGFLSGVKENWDKHFKQDPSVQMSKAQKSYKQNQQEFAKEAGDAGESLSQGDVVDAALSAGDSLASAGKGTSTAMKARMDWATDNQAGGPNLQENAQGFVKNAYAGMDYVNPAGKGAERMSDKELAKRMQRDFTSYQQATDSVSNAAKGVPVVGDDINQGSDFVLGGLHDAFVAEPAGAMTAATTGVNVNADTASTEAKTTPIEFAELAFGGAGKAVKGASKGMGLLDEGVKLVDDGLSKSDDVGSASGDVTIPSGSGEDVTANMDTFDGMARDVGADDQYLKGTEQVNSIEGPSATKTGDETTDINKNAGDTSGASGATDPTLEINGRQVTVEELTRAQSSKAASGAEESVVGSLRRGPNGMSQFNDELSQRLNEIRRGDEAADDATKAADDTATGTPDTIRGRIARMLGRASGRIPGWSGLGWKGKTVLGGTTIAVGANAMKDVIPSGSNTGPNNSNGYWVKALKTYSYQGKDLAKLVVTGRGQERLGYNVILGKTKAGIVQVIDADGKPKAVEYVQTKQKGTYYKPVFESIGAAEDAWQSLVDRATDKSGNDQQGNGPTPNGKSSMFTGALSPPKAVKQGSSFEVGYKLSLAPQTKSGSGRFVLAALTGNGSAIGLAETNASLSASATGGSATKTGTFTVPSGQLSVSPGDYPLVLISMSDKGKVAQAGLTVKPADKGDKTREGSKWDDPQRVRKLPRGWHLYAQTKVGSNETRFMVIGKSNGKLVFCHKDGRARSEPYYFPNVKQAITAFKRWVKRVENGNAATTPDPEADRPKPSRVKKATEAHDSRMGRGSLQSVTSFARNNPVTLGAGVFAVAVAAYLAKSKGWI